MLSWKCRSLRYLVLRAGRALKIMIDQQYPDIRESSFKELYERIRPYTLTSVERMYALYKAVRHVVDHDLPGDLVECGVWKGGSTMMMAEVLALRRATDREIYLYDTFEGMTPPTEADLDLFGTPAKDLLEEPREENLYWAFAPLEGGRSESSADGLPLRALPAREGTGGANARPSGARTDRRSTPGYGLV